MKGLQRGSWGDEICTSTNTQDEEKPRHRLDLGNVLIDLSILEAVIEEFLCRKGFTEEGEDKMIGEFVTFHKENSKTDVHEVLRLFSRHRKSKH